MPQLKRPSEWNRVILTPKHHLINIMLILKFHSFVKRSRDLMQSLLKLINQKVKPIKKMILKNSSKLFFISRRNSEMKLDTFMRTIRVTTENGKQRRSHILLNCKTKMKHFQGKTLNLNSFCKTFSISLMML